MHAWGNRAAVRHTEPWMQLMKATLARIGQAIALIGLMLAVAPVASADTCTFTYGFADIHAAAPDIVGMCVDDAIPVRGPGAQQHTTKGLLVWDQSTGVDFTDGYWTYHLGGAGSAHPYIAYKRLNTEAPPASQVATAAAPSAPAPARAPQPQPTSRFPNGDGNPSDVASQATALMCQAMTATFCNDVSTNPIFFAVLNGPSDSGGYTFGEILSRSFYTSGLGAAHNPIYIDQRFLTWPIDQTASVLIHESQHIYDAEISHPVMASFESQRECMLSEQNALNDQAQFWIWLYPNGSYPQRNSFDAWAAENAQTYVNQGTVVPTSC